MKSKKTRCCNNCFAPAGEKYFFNLPSGRTAYFCSYKCRIAWLKSREEHIQEKEKGE